MKGGRGNLPRWKCHSCVFRIKDLGFFPLKIIFILNVSATSPAPHILKDQNEIFYSGLNKTRHSNKNKWLFLKKNFPRPVWILVPLTCQWCEKAAQAQHSAPVPIAALCLHRQPGMSPAQSPDHSRVMLWPSFHLKKMVLTIWVIKICLQDKVKGWCLLCIHEQPYTSILYL